MYRLYYYYSLKYVEMYGLFADGHRKSEKIFFRPRLLAAIGSSILFQSPFADTA